MSEELLHNKFQTTLEEDYEYLKELEEESESEEEEQEE
eukprot:CAMPEP_0176402490 /NCGR_PEP_ID=MMETSP0126-20121128/49311_1 /TAXON_ID=141414 ORGANISM="Strombidinopsis acuminatum, Strain SPMC142" /NCGR_SAMPLE_ID=MMETSP0126 /ASSEMBLY_ACC=CAM_ASM_000229 /LENGTH=37 /DNA_ID= /DNA_START= /DNA_END= /DNA_ORIENTATION=